MLSVSMCLRISPSALFHRALIRTPRHCFVSKNHAASFTVPEDKVEFSFTTSQGPGGQNVNKVNTCVEIRFNVSSADWVGSQDVRDRLALQQKGRMSNKGDLIVSCQEHRTQKKNRSTCLAKLVEMVVAARVEPKERKLYASISEKGKEQRKTDKRNRSKVKSNRSGKVDW